ncbi:hypothetical protein E4U42_003312 [Claviceps africana]|uniref:N-acetyltransferase domain-containing protein n=1 Tax=Claviceps africana TaxID=83212 RepID=A0A8K0J7K3_9HYPO|nr:hypothetical protein E4U42_003312 [Claviceps africana]
MASPTAKSLSSTPTRNYENLSQLCKEMKSWIFHLPHTPQIDTSLESPRSDSLTAEIAADGSNREPPGQDGASAAGTDTSKPEAKDAAQRTTSHSDVHSKIEDKSAEDMPAPGKTGDDLASTNIREMSTSQLSVILEAGEHSPKSTAAPLSAVESSSSGPFKDPMSRPLGIIQAAIPCPIGLETKACLEDKGWSISSDCSSDHADMNIMFGPSFPQTFPNRSDSGSGDCVIREGINNDSEGDAVLYPHDPVKSWLVQHLTSPSLVVSLDKIGDLVNSRCDIDPQKGTFLPPVLQPETLRCAMEGPCENYHDVLWRQNNMTTELHVMRELRSRENMATSLRMALGHETDRFDSPGESGQPWPKANCIVRPATQLDIPTIAKIFNDNNRRAMKSQDNESLFMRAEDVARIWDKCRADSRPFIVVTPAEEDFLDRSKWPHHSQAIYEEFVRFMAKNIKPVPSLVGFAFIESSRLGMNDCACPGASYSGHLTLIVDPEYRRKLYGSALLDRILISISPLHTSVVDHDWSRDQDDSDGIYEFPANRNVRQYTLLHVEVLESHDGDEPSDTRDQFLKKFGFEEVGRLTNVLATEDDQRHVHWQDLVTWARNITPTSNVISGW